MPTWIHIRTFIQIKTKGIMKMDKTVLINQVILLFLLRFTAIEKNFVIVLVGYCVYNIVINIIDW